VLFAFASLVSSVPSRNIGWEVCLDITYFVSSGM